MSMTLATTWVRRGVAAQRPIKYEVDEAELGRISKLARLQLEEAQQGLTDAQNEHESEEGDGKGEKEKEYNLDDYDDDAEQDEAGEPVTMFGNVRALAYHGPGEEDPYLVLPAGEKDLDDDEREDLQILPTDNLILAAKVEDEVAHLEVMVYEDDADNLYVHHDIMLPAVPLCVEWIDVAVGSGHAEKRQQANFVAVGTMSPEIELWDLDVVDSMYPNAILGREPWEQDKGKKKKKAKANDEYHVDASYTMHTDKVCALDWHPAEGTVLLSGSYDRTVVVTDMRAPDAAAPRWRVDTDVERVRWDIHDPNFFYVTTESGLVYYFDAQKPPKSVDKTSKPVWRLQAHDGPVSAFDINAAVPGFLATGSEDKKTKLWSVQDNKPSMVVARNLDVGRIFAANFGPDPDVAFRLSVAGSRGQVQVWDTSTNAAVRSVFAGRVKMAEGGVKERLVGATGQSDSEQSDQSDEDDHAQGDDGWESMDQD
ncbi:hypothetical protein DV736_g1010, partial [Chaetothyriales sp. CBS 134916]